MNGSVMIDRNEISPPIECPNKKLGMLFPSYFFNSSVAKALKSSA